MTGSKAEVPVMKHTSQSIPAVSETRVLPTNEDRVYNMCAIIITEILCTAMGADRHVSFCLLTRLKQTINYCFIKLDKFKRLTSVFYSISSAQRAVN